MVNEKQLAIVRAALQYFDEEFSPNLDSFAPYLDEDGLLLDIANEDIRATRESFSNLRPRQVMIDIESSKLVMKQHFASKDAMVSKTPARRIKFATLLLPGDWIN